MLPPHLDEVLGEQFYHVDPASGRAQDFLLDSSADALQVFRARVDDVAQDLSCPNARVTAQKVAEGVWYLNGATHHSAVKEVMYHVSVNVLSTFHTLNAVQNIQG